MEVAKLIITMADDGRVDVNGPIANKLLCFGILEMAKIAIQNFDPGKIIPAQIVPFDISKKPQG